MDQLARRHSDSRASAGDAPPPPNPPIRAHTHTHKFNVRRGAPGWWAAAAERERESEFSLFLLTQENGSSLCRCLRKALTLLLSAEATCIYCEGRLSSESASFSSPSRALSLSFFAWVRERERRPAGGGASLREWVLFAAATAAAASRGHARER